MASEITRFVAVDWSGAQSPAEQRKRIVVADWNAGAVGLTAGRTRAETTAWLIAQAQRTPAMVVGMDFSFSFPAWFVRECLATAEEISIDAFWQLAASRAEEWLRGCEPPFWGRPQKTCPAQHRALAWRGYRVCERPEVIGWSPKSTFQVGGAGAVGTGSLRGIATLIALREAGFCVWPFHPFSLPCVIEIYPRSFTGPVRKSDKAARTAYLQLHFGGKLSKKLLAVAALSEDAFDALCSVIAMARQREHFSDLKQASDPTTLLEGAIFPGQVLA